MNKLINKLKKLLFNIKTIIITVYNYLDFLFNKQKTLQKIYEPLINNKLKENEDLKSRLAFISAEVINIENTKRKFEKENSKYQMQISIIQELLIKNKTMG